MYIEQHAEAKSLPLRKTLCYHLTPCTCWFGITTDDIAIGEVVSEKDGNTGMYTIVYLLVDSQCQGSCWAAKYAVSDLGCIG